MAQKNTKSTSLDRETHALARKTADEYNLSLIEVFEQATERLYKKAFFETLQADFLRLTRINEAWKQEIRHREVIGINLPDGEYL
ncbi:MAG: hypothetical protein WD491_06590 [Balneolales bacterium]